MTSSLYLQGRSVLLLAIVCATSLFAGTCFILQLSLYRVLTKSLNSLDHYGSFPHETRPMNYSFDDKSPKLPWKDDNTLLDIIDFRFLTNNATMCQRGHSFFNILPILVHTGRYNFNERRAIRDTYGSVKRYRKWYIQLVFLLGEAVDGVPAKEIRLSKEIRVFGDIVIGNFLDIYTNLPYKHLMGYKWILNFCHLADFVLKVDDDMFIDVVRIIDANLHVPSVNRDWVCNIFANMTPQRDPTSKYFVGEDKYSGNIYPTYCSGWCYGITVEWIYKIYSVSQKVECCIIDDVFVTGVLRVYAEKVYNETASLQNEFWQEVTYDTKAYENLCLKLAKSDQRHFGSVVYVARGDYLYSDMMCLWEKTVETYEEVSTI